MEFFCLIIFCFLGGSGSGFGFGISFGTGFMYRGVVSIREKKEREELRNKPSVGSLFVREVCGLLLLIKRGVISGWKT